MNYRLLLPLLLLGSTLSSHAEERWFEVELLLFQRNVDLQDISETLATDNIEIDSTKSISLIKKPVNTECAAEMPCPDEFNPVLISSTLFDSQLNHFQRVENDQLQLSEQREKLSQHAAFTPLLHVAWQMPIESRRRAKPLYLFAGKNLAFSSQAAGTAASSALNTDNRAPDNSLDSVGKDLSSIKIGTIDATANAPFLSDEWAIEGNLKIYLDHYLFIDSQLVIRQEITENKEDIATSLVQNIEVLSSENDVQVIKQTQMQAPVAALQKTLIKKVLFDQSRRLRSDEIHYFDHPLMGMIVQIRKITQEKQDEMAAKQSSSEVSQEADVQQKKI